MHVWKVRYAVESTNRPTATVHTDGNIYQMMDIPSVKTVRAAVPTRSRTVIFATTRVQNLNSTKLVLCLSTVDHIAYRTTMNTEQTGFVKRRRSHKNSSLSSSANSPNGSDTNEVSMRFLFNLTRETTDRQGQHMHGRNGSLLKCFYLQRGCGRHAPNNM